MTGPAWDNAVCCTVVERVYLKGHTCKSGSCFHDEVGQTSCLLISIADPTLPEDFALSLSPSPLRMRLQARLALPPLFVIWTRVHLQIYCFTFFSITTLFCYDMIQSPLVLPIVSIHASDRFSLTLFFSSSNHYPFCYVSHLVTTYLYTCARTTLKSQSISPQLNAFFSYCSQI